MDVKTNAMRALEKAKSAYKSHCYAHLPALSGLEVAQALGHDPAHVFKTLVTVAKSRKHYVFLVPVAAELDLKKAAHSVQEKAVAMVKSKELFPLTGYVHGGCSPLGMKKLFTTTIDRTAADHATLVFSAGKIGYQIETSLEELKKALPFQLADLVG